MRYQIGIDIGGSTIKAAVYDMTPDSPGIRGTFRIPTADPKAAAAEAISLIHRELTIQPSDVRQIVLTGQRASFFHEDISGIPTCHIDELQAIGAGGLLLTGLREALVVSMGTGTAFVLATADGVRHLGGSALGGGTITGLASRLLHIDDFGTLNRLAQAGDRRKADLMVGDLQDGAGTGLSGELTAANFGKIDASASDADIAAALFHMIYENTGVFSVFALRDHPVRDVVVAGSLAELPQARSSFDVFNGMHDIFRTRFHIPEKAGFAAVLGAMELARKAACD